MMMVMDQRNLLSGLLVFILWLCWASPSGAMEFAPFASRAGVAIRATGVIEIGDAAKFQHLIPNASVDEKGLRRIILESPGGNVGEAMRIAKLIRANDFVTLVGGECASACGMILYPAGRYFMLLDGGKLGFHSCYDSRSLAEQPECTEDIAKFAASNGFPYGSLKIFASLAGPAEMYWVTNVLAYCYGMERFIGEPAPITISTLCPYVRLTLITAKFREPDRPLGPSFDCNKAIGRVSILLCKDQELMHLDALMGELYRMMRRREGGHSELLVAQRAWVADRDKKCKISAADAASYESSRNAARCVSEMIMARMNELLELNGTPRYNFSPVP
jgi:uncharacterized protein YecT (DUF1311 family)